MRNDQIFVLMLVILLPMSGCFDGAVGDAEGADDESETTVINNYYNNTTVEHIYQNITQITEPTTYYMHGNFSYTADANQYGNWQNKSQHSEWFDVFTINQSSNQIVSILSLNYVALVNYSECESYWEIGDCGHSQRTLDYMMYDLIPAHEGTRKAITCANGLSTYTEDEPRTGMYEEGINANFPGMDCSFTYQVRNYHHMEVWWSVSYTIEEVSPGPHN